MAKSEPLSKREFHSQSKIAWFKRYDHFEIQVADRYFDAVGADGAGRMSISAIEIVFSKGLIRIRPVYLTNRRRTQPETMFSSSAASRHLEGQKRSLRF